MVYMTQNLKDQTPEEIDTVLAANWEQQFKVTSRILSAEATIKRYDGNDFALYQRYADEARVTITEQVEILRQLDAEAAPYEAEYNERVWSRYFIVNNVNGHVHRSRSCSTCFPTTVYSWIPSLSGCDEAALVAEYGEVACTVCFPDAPARKGFGDGTSAIARYSEAEKAQRLAEKDAKRAAKQAKLLVEPVQVTNGGGNRSDLIETIAAAKRWIKEAIDYRIAYGYDTFDTPETFTSIDLLVEALAAKDIDAKSLIAKWTKAAEKEAGK